MNRSGNPHHTLNISALPSSIGFDQSLSRPPTPSTAANTITDLKTNRIWPNGFSSGLVVSPIPRENTGEAKASSKCLPELYDFNPPPGKSSP